MHPFNCSLVVMIAITGPSLLGATAYYARSSPQVSTSCQVTVTCGHWHISPNGHQVPVGLLLRTSLRLWLLESKEGFLGMVVYLLRFLLFPPVWPSCGLVSPGGVGCRPVSRHSLLIRTVDHRWCRSFLRFKTQFTNVFKRYLLFCVSAMTNVLQSVLIPSSSAVEVTLYRAVEVALPLRFRLSVCVPVIIIVVWHV